MMMGGGSQKVEGVQLVLLMVAGPPSHTWPHHLHLHHTAGHVRPLHRLNCWQWEHSYALQPSLLCVGETNRCVYVIDCPLLLVTSRLRIHVTSYFRVCVCSCELCSVVAILPLLFGRIYEAEGTSQACLANP